MIDDSSQTIRPHNNLKEVLVAGEADAVQDEEEGELFGEGDAEVPEVIDVADEDLEQAEDQDREGAAARILPDPGNPTTSQIEDHRAKGHIPYRTWCKECVEGRSTGEPHRRRTGERSVCVLSFDYLYLDKAGGVMKKNSMLDMEDVSVTILVAKESRGKSIFAHVVPQKGVDMDHYAVELLLQDLKWVGYQQISLRSDNERSILRLLEHAVTEARIELKGLDQVLEEHPNTYDSSGNGEIEVAAKSLTGILRTNKLDVEKKVG